MSMTRSRWLLSTTVILVFFGQGLGPVKAQVEEGFLEGADGVRIHYQKLGQGGEALVVLHGTPSRMYFMAPDFGPLAEDHTLIFYDQRGGGESELIEDPEHLGWEYHVRDLEALRLHFGLDQLNLFGKSWGSVLAALYASEYPDRVGKLVLSTMRIRRDAPRAPSTLSDDDRARLQEILGEWKAAEDLPALCEEYWDIMTGSNPEYSRMKGSMCKEPAEALRVTWDTNRALQGSWGDWDWRPRFAGIKVPTLLVKGEEAETGILVAREWLEVIPDSRLVLIPGARALEWVANPDVFFRAVREFLQGEWPEGAVTGG